MEHRKIKIMINKAGGNSGPGSYNYRISIPTTWAKEMGITKQDNAVDISFEQGTITIKKEPQISSLNDFFFQGYSLQERICLEICNVYKTIGNAFFYDKNSGDFYLVNFHEKTYFKLKDDSPYYDLLRHLYCHDWEQLETLMLVHSTYREVERLEQVDGSEK